MSVVQITGPKWGVKCDICEKAYAIPKGKNPKISAALQRARILGWVVVDQKDVCPDCRVGKTDED